MPTPATSTPAVPSPKGKGVLSLVMIPAIITLVVTLVRLIGELCGWNDFLFNSGVGEVDADGEVHNPGMFGIVWLVPVFGFYFAKRLGGKKGGPGFTRAISFTLGGLLVTAGLIAAFVMSDWLVFPSVENPGDPQGLGYAMIAILIGTCIGFLAWPSLAWTLLVYGFLARIPVIFVTGLAVSMDWQTHHTKLPPGIPPKAGFDLWMGLITPQLTLWVAFTVLAGGLVGAFTRLGKSSDDDIAVKRSVV